MHIYLFASKVLPQRVTEFRNFEIAEQKGVWPQAYECTGFIPLESFSERINTRILL